MEANSVAVALHSATIGSQRSSSSEWVDRRTLTSLQSNSFKISVVAAKAGIKIAPIANKIARRTIIVDLEGMGRSNRSTARLESETAELKRDYPWCSYVHLACE